ncbi:sigma factor-binding protein Crl [Arsenophonus nasoniae]|uniref:Sigma factor-binding protein Crl n=1 Tax=Arsenophonus nasoniae TaxID=638 RepID=D2U044_9GAMM|nr:sigma factor-binding protein Crl [Arsenophonus nasoniae]QBY42429.1 Sigma factor-binding protein Crl [Arsenophonus nasoniae]WGL94713.1 sigma factor-binding protein Crl [Arsenophonus nasoniae]WGM02363.1 sigma factor-binding protein Crl [Arsenophonus nasoniae]WGM06547.1 sigma factor-binding protein Crl [Arsenophonus nasoniae]WGM11486.1 sigma factor-binding protein Crl [Arsenophonus nasoniae]
MALTSNYSKSKLLKHFTRLGPYLRESLCQDDLFFFDCLAICVNAKTAPEKREFWGWWLELRGELNGFVYHYKLGMFDKAGNWQHIEINKSNIIKSLEDTLQEFHKRLSDSLNTLELTLTPCPKMVAINL